MTEAEFKKHLDAAEKSPKEIAAAVSFLPEEVLRYKPSPDKWCVLEILGHLADIEIVYGYRLRQMLADQKPVIAPMDQDAWAGNLGYMEAPARRNSRVLWHCAPPQSENVAPCDDCRLRKVRPPSRINARSDGCGNYRANGRARDEPSATD